ncbi:MAG TPA: hypothetical protein DD381_12055 [Lentisphaeria bacterium]|nr:hypothetical protein [Lentisphaeria bacterium]
MLNLPKSLNLQGKARKISSPIIEESPISIECVVKEIKTLGSHDMFISEVVSINADEKPMSQIL